MHGLWGFITDGLGLIVFLLTAVATMIGNSVMAGYAVNYRATVWDNAENAEFTAAEKQRLERRSRWFRWGVILTILPGFVANVLLLVASVSIQADFDFYNPMQGLVPVGEMLACVAWVSYLLRARRRWHDKEHLMMPFSWLKDSGGDTD